MRNLFLLSLLSGAFTIGAAPSTAAQDLTWAEIKLPYEQWQQLWAATQLKPSAKTNAPPVSALIKSANYELSANSNGVILRAVYMAENLTDQWQALPLLGGDAKLAAIDSTKATVAWRHDTYSLLTGEKGSRRVEAVFTLPRSVMREGIKFVPGPASVCSLRVAEMPEDQTLEVLDLDPTSVENGSIVWHFPGSGGEYRLRFTEPRPAPAPIQPSNWSLESELFVTEANGRLQHDCLIHAVATSGSALKMNVLLPPGAAGIQFTGDDEMEGRVLPRSGLYRVLQLRWKTRDIADRRIELSYSLAVTSTSAWRVIPPKSESENLSRTTIALPRHGGQERTPNEGTPLDSTRASRWLQEKAGEVALDLFESRGPAEFAIRWLPRIQTAQAMVSAAEYETRLVDDGAMLITGKLLIDHRQAVDLSLTMPNFEEVLTGKLNGSATQPIRRSENVIEFSLPANTNGKSELEFSYAAQGEAFDAVSGRLELQLPMTALFIHSLKWQLDIPDRFETSAIQGNVGSDSKSKEMTHDLQLIKRLVRREHPFVQIHYRRRGLDD